MSLFKNSILIILIINLLIGCSSGSIYRELFENLSILFQDPQDIPEKEFKKIIYSTKQARIGRSKNSIIVLEEINEDIYKWTSSNFVKVYTKNNYVMRLTGLGNELDNIDFDPSHPANTKNFEQIIGEELTSFYTFNDPSLHRLPVKTLFSFVGNEVVLVSDREYDTKVYKEKSQGNLISWNFTNYFWVDENNEIIKSIQSFTPKNPQIYLKKTP